MLSFLNVIFGTSKKCELTRDCYELGQRIVTSNVEIYPYYYEPEQVEDHVYRLHFKRLPYTTYFEYNTFLPDVYITVEEREDASRVSIQCRLNRTCKIIIVVAAIWQIVMELLFLILKVSGPFKAAGPIIFAIPPLAFIACMLFMFVGVKITNRVTVYTILAALW